MLTANSLREVMLTQANTDLLSIIRESITSAEGLNQNVTPRLDALCHEYIFSLVIVEINLFCFHVN